GQTSILRSSGRIMDDAGVGLRSESVEAGLPLAVPRGGFLFPRVPQLRQLGKTPPAGNSNRNDRVASSGYAGRSDNWDDVPLRQMMNPPGRPAWIAQAAIRNRRGTDHDPRKFDPS